MNRESDSYVLLELAAAAVAPAIGSLGALAGGALLGPVGVMAGFAAGHITEKVVEVLAPHVVSKWLPWMRKKGNVAGQAALVELANEDPDDVKDVVQAKIEECAPDDTAKEHREQAIKFVTAISGSIKSCLVPDPQRRGQTTLPATINPESESSLRELMPTELPPYLPPCRLEGTGFHLRKLIGAGGFGAVYLATHAEFAGKRFAVKFCLKPEMKQSLQKEKDVLEHLEIAGDQKGWPASIVQLESYNLEHPTPYLVYEYVGGGDLSKALEKKRLSLGRPFSAKEVFSVMFRIADALTAAHDRNLVHRDLKPANILVAARDAFKLTDFGIGQVVARLTAEEAGAGSDGGKKNRSISQHAQDLRGAGTLLYMSPEHKAGKTEPDPRDDVYSFGVIWFQILVGDLAREVPPLWERELARIDVPQSHINLIGSCLDEQEDRIANAREVLEAMTRLSPRRRSGKGLYVGKDQSRAVALRCDPHGFPLLEIVEDRLDLLLFPVTKIHYEIFLEDTGMYNEDWKDELYKLNPAVDNTKFTSQEREQLFLTGVEPDEACAFCRWLGEGFDLPTAEEWRLIDRVLRATPFRQAKFKEDVNKLKFNETAKAMLIRLEKQIQPEWWSELTLLREGVLEWVRSVRAPGAYEGLGSPRQSFMQHTYNPDLIDDFPHLPLEGERSRVFGIRVIRRRYST